MITGARQGKLSGLKRLVAAAMARDLNVFLVPGPDIARAYGLDIEAAGLHQVASPRHASVLLVVGAISPVLRDAAAVVYAQMARPRALFFLGAEDLSPLPAADVATGLSQQDFVEGVRQLRRVFSEGAFRPDVSDFDAPVLQIRIEYTCPMHPEVIQDEPGSCPKCGMFLVPREVQAGVGHTHTDQETTDTDMDMQVKPSHDQHTHHNTDHDAAVEYTCPMHPEVVQNEPGSCPKCGMNLELREAKPESTHEHQHMDHEAAVEYTCPMHPEVVQNEPGACPKCGMNLEPREAQPESAHDHHHMDHDAAVEYTCPMHPEVVQSEPGSCPKCGMNLEPREAQPESAHDHHHMDHEAAVEYTCPMHPEVVQSE
ncbi:Lead, cadmium, zinc and mercury transporting ATPase; Copper-translocating P-type ATPase, partial [hydrothermal vent metagenome]